MKRKRNYKISFIGWFTTLLGAYLLSQVIVDLVISLMNLPSTFTFSEIMGGVIWGIVSLIILTGGIAFLSFRRWSLYLVRTSLLISVAVILLTIFSYFIFADSELPLVPYLIFILLAITALFILNLKPIEEHFN